MFAPVPQVTRGVSEHGRFKKMEETSFELWPLFTLRVTNRKSRTPPAQHAISA